MLVQVENTHVMDGAGVLFPWLPPRDEVTFQRADWGAPGILPTWPSWQEAISMIGPRAKPSWVVYLSWVELRAISELSQGHTVSALGSKTQTLMESDKRSMWEVTKGHNKKWVGP